MAELEIHHEHGEGAQADSFGRRIGILTACLAVFLAIVTIESHRAHTAGVLSKADANDKWSYYQSTRIKFHNLELGNDLIGLIAPKDEASSSRLAAIKAEMKREAKKADDIQAEARGLENAVATAEKQALRFDIGEGLIEIGLVLSSLYFIAKKKYFPLIGIISGVAGILVAATGLLI